ncbi:ATP-binding cassette domain-containing protein [Bacillus spongiae]|uniref:ATP-binding cassette domain-containing protein n=1 Tax=Bacillus spongiae TaxID=2683610 RepID=A0ABU8H9D6_9BACI
MFTLKNIVYKDILRISELLIEQGKVTCIIGASGSGKTTLLKLLNKMVIPNSGEIFFKGKPLSEKDAILHRREVSMLAQTPLVFEGDIERNLQIGRLFAEKKPASLSALKEILKAVSLEKELHGSPSSLSGGESQRLSLARILLVEPSVYLFDEPTSALDKETEMKVMDSVLSKVKQQGGSAIIVTHSHEVSDRYGEEIISLS